jgi:hypothetical protein
MHCQYLANSTQARATRSRRRPAQRSGWRLWTLLVVAFCFVLLTSTAATHRHTTPASARDCAVCAAVADKLVDTPAPPVVSLVLRLQPYAVFEVGAYIAPYVALLLTPPSCGPPTTSA